MGRWEMVRLGDVADVGAGQGAPQGEIYYADKGLPFIRAGHLGDLISGSSESALKRITEKDAASHKLRIYQKGTILFAKSGMSCLKGYIYCLKGDCYVVNHLACIKPINVSAGYLKYYFSAFPPNRLIKDESYPSISLADISNTILPLPPLAVQRKIADALDHAVTLIGKRKAQIEKLDVLSKSRFIEMFGHAYTEYKQYYLPQLCSFIDYRGKTPEKSFSGIPLITAKNVKDNHFCIEPQEFIPTENYEAVMTRGKPRANDVLFTTEAPLGNVCRIPPVFERFCVGQRIITMQPKTEKITPEYLEYALLTKRFQDDMWKKSSGSTVKGIRSKELALIKIPLPPLGSQKEFSALLHSIDRLREKLLNQLLKMETNYNSLMQKCFRGEIF